MIDLIAWIVKLTAQSNRKWAFCNFGLWPVRLTQFSGPNKSRDELGQINPEPLDFEKDLPEHQVKREDSTNASLWF